MYIRHQIAAILLVLPLCAQPPGNTPPAVAKAAAPIDLTGYWVSIVTEDWRYRMVMPAAGDYQGVPMTAAALKVAREWAPGKDGDACKAYGAPALLRVPERLHITWQDDQTLRMDTDAGKQSRIFHFGDWKAPAGPHTLQGDSTAQWELHRPPGPGIPRNGSLKGCDSESESRLSAQKWGSLQRERYSYGILRFGKRSQRVHVAGGDHRGY